MSGVAASESWRDPGPIRIGVSTCLLGEKVRWDGGERRDAFLVDVLGPHVEWISLCPELEIGMGVPREPVQLVRRGDEIRLLAKRSGEDWTARIKGWSERQVRALTHLELCGYVLKKDSPSCGPEGVELHCETGGRIGEGQGIFASELRRRLPELPVEDEDRLRDPVLRENFIERIFACRRLRALFRGRWNTKRLAVFHKAHELQLEAHSSEAHRSLVRLIRSAATVPRQELRERYEREFMSALTRSATPSRHSRILERCFETLRPELDPRARAELAGLIADYRACRVPLMAPLSEVRHQARLLSLGHLSGQVYLDPDPREQELRDRLSSTGTPVA